GKQFGQIVTFQSPKKFKEAVDEALKLFSAGGLGEAVPKVWDEVEPAYKDALKCLREIAGTPGDVPSLSDKEKKRFAKSFQGFDSLLAQLKAFTNFEGKSIEDYGMTDQEYADYAAHYQNILAEIRASKEGDQDTDDTPGQEAAEAPDPDYELIAYSKATIDYEYILNLIQNIVSSMDEGGEDEEDIQKKIGEVREYVDDLRKANSKLGEIMGQIVDNLEQDRSVYKGLNISEIFESMKKEALLSVIDEFSKKWYADRDAVLYAAEYSHDGEIPNSNVLKETANYAEYKENTEDPAPKFTYRSMMVKELGQVIAEEILPLR
ncbi:MAG: type I restriction endonuclease subunit R, partial [Lachnospiraceae bacterium]|nr:type I restriction endonuclease subunit R [Lachnospiraceae bacterium]